MRGMDVAARGQIAKVELVWRYFYQRHLMPRFLSERDFEVFLPPTFESMVLQIKTMVAGERVKEIRYPLDWWQAFRERWLPQFWLAWFPVRYHEWHVDLLYPMIQRRRIREGEEPTIAVYSNEQPHSPGFLPNPPVDDDHG